MRRRLASGAIAAACVVLVWLAALVLWRHGAAGWLVAFMLCAMAAGLIVLFARVSRLGRPADPREAPASPHDKDGDLENGAGTP